MRRSLLALAGVALVSFTAAAHAALLDFFQLDIRSNTNVPTFELRNLATATADVTSFSFIIGHTARGFDFYTAVSAGGGITYTFNGLDTVDNGLRSQLLDIDFTGFTPGLLFRFDTDVDDLNANVTRDFRTVFWNNGAQPNSVLTVAYSDSQTLSLTLPDNPTALSGTGFSNHYRFTLQGDATAGVIPEPQTYALLLAGLGLLGFAARPKNRRLP